MLSLAAEYREAAKLLLIRSFADEVAHEALYSTVSVDSPGLLNQEDIDSIILTVLNE